MFKSDAVQIGAGCPLIASIGVSDMGEAQAAYENDLGYRCVDATSLSAGYAKVWGDDTVAGRATRLLQPASGAPIFIRLIEADKDSEIPTTPPPGWFALELCVKDSASLHEKLLASDYFTPFAPPIALAFSDKIFPFQCRGRNGEILYLNETRGNLPDIDLPLAVSDVDHIFIVIMSAEDMEQSTEFYKKALGISLKESHVIPYKTINRVFGLPLETLHKLNTLGQDRHVFIEIDQFPNADIGALNLQEMPPRTTVPLGICCVSLAAQEFPAAVEKHDCPDIPYENRAIGQMTGPNGERVELIKL